MRYKIHLLFFIICLSGCSTSLGLPGNLGYSDGREVVIVGENVSPEIAAYYQHKYGAAVWFTPSQGVVTQTAQVLLKGIGPTKAMRSLINELMSINYTVGRWQVIIPKIAERYFLATLKQMPNGALSKARGAVVLIDSLGNTQMEYQVKRVTGDNFIVVYEFQKF